MSACFKIVCANGFVPFLSMLLLRVVCRTLNQVLGESDSFPLDIYATLTASQLRHIAQMQSLRLGGKRIHLKLVEYHSDPWRLGYPSSESFIGEDMLLVRSLCRKMGRLHTLDMSHLDNVSEICYGFGLLARCKTLKSLSIASADESYIDNDDLDVISGIATLETLELNGGYDVGDMGLSCLASLPLKTLKITGADITGDGIGPLLERMPDLEVLCLHGEPEWDWHNNHKVTLPRLKTLDMRDIPVHLGCISDYPHLQRLCLVEAGITDNQLHYLRSLPLTTLDLSHNPLCGDGLCNLDKMQLVELDLSYCSLTSLLALPPLDLRELSLCANYDLGDESILHLGHSCPVLEVLGLGDCRLVSDRGLCELPPLLVSLDLNYCRRIGDEGLGHLKHCRLLSSLYLCATSTTDAGVSHLRSLSNLRILKLGGCPGVTTKALPYVADLSLSELFLGKTSISREDMDLYPNLPCTGFKVSEIMKASFSHEPAVIRRSPTDEECAALDDAIMNEMSDDDW